MENSALPKTQLCLAYLVWLGLTWFYFSIFNSQLTSPKSGYNGSLSFTQWIFIKALNTWIMKCRHKHINLAELFPFSLFLNTYFSPVYQRQMATTFWYTEYLPSHVVCFWSNFYSPSFKWADSSFIHLFLLLTSCIFRNLTSALSKW